MRLQLKSLVPGGNYAVQVRGVTDSGYTDWSQVFRVATSSDTTPPAVPINLTLNPQGTSFVAAWNAVTDLDFNYYIVKFTAGPNSVQFQTTATNFEFTYLLNKAAFPSPQSSVTVSVASVDSTGNISAFSSGVGATNAAPNPVTNLVGTALYDSLGASWTAPSDIDIDGYEFHIGTTANFATSSATLKNYGKATAFTYQTTVYGSDAYMAVIAVDTFGSKSTAVYAGPLRPKNAANVDITPPAVPAGLTAALSTNPANLSTTMTVSWTAVSATDLDKYVINYRVTGTTNWSSVVADQSTTTIAIPNLQPYVNYDVEIRAADSSSNYSGWSATVTTTTAATDVAPSTPQAPTVAGNTMQIQVNVSGLKADGVTPMEPDVNHYDVYASTTGATFTPSSANKIGTIAVSPAMVGTYNIPASGSSGTSQTWYVRVVAVDNGQNQSPATAGVTATVQLISSINIGQATITAANIGSVDAGTIQAGSTFTNNLNVKSVFTLGDATTDGVIQSSDFSGTSTGFKLAKSGLIINQGQIAAAALKLQQGHNLAPLAYSGFEFAPTSIAYSGMFKSYAFFSADPSQFKFGSQSGNQTWFAAAGNRSKVTFGQAANDYNIPVNPNTKYIFSVYARSTSVAMGYNFVVTDNNAVVTNVMTGTLDVTGNWVRYSGVYTTSGTASAVNLGTDFAADHDGAVFIDAIQFEEQWGAISTPSAYHAPSSTSVDGGYIRTGQIQSTSTVSVNGTSQPYWSINLSGAAQFGSASVRGTLIVGASGDPDLGQSYIASGNFSSGSAGWKIDSSGAAEFNTGTFRGAIAIGTPIALSPPTISMVNTIGLGPAWTLGAGTFYYKLTAVNGGGETIGSNELSTTLTTSSHCPAISWPALSGGLTGVKIYRGTAAGAENLLVATIPGSGAAQWTDVNNAGTAATVPAANTTANSSQIVKIDSNGLYIGNTTFATAPFTVDLGGNLSALKGTITASDLQTAKSGRRIHMGAADGGGTISFYTGNANEITQGSIAVQTFNDGVGDYGEIDIVVPSINNGYGGFTPQFTLRQANPGASNPGSSVNIQADTGNLGPLSWNNTASGAPQIGGIQFNGGDVIVPGTGKKYGTGYILSTWKGLTANVGTFSTATKVTQLSGTTITLTANRQYKVTCRGMVFTSTANTTATVFLYQNGSSIQQSGVFCGASGVGNSYVLETIVSGTGSATFDIYVNAGGIAAGTAYPAMFWIEDLGSL